ADLWTDPTHTQPVAAALMSGEFLVIAGEGQAYSEEEAGQWLEQTGWQKLDRRPLAGAASLIVAEATEIPRNGNTLKSTLRTRDAGRVGHPVSKELKSWFARCP